MEEHPSCYVEGCFAAPNFASEFVKSESLELKLMCDAAEDQRRSAFFDVVMGRMSYQQATDPLSLYT